MSRSKNVSFMESYILLENASDTVTGKRGGGVSAYIFELERQKLDTGAEETLKYLKRYRSIRNKLAHDSGALKTSTEIGSADIKRINRLTSKIKKYADPLSRLRRKRSSFSMKLKLGVLISAIAILGITAFFLIKEIAGKI